MMTKKSKGAPKKKFTAQEVMNFAYWYSSNGRPFECNMAWHLEKWLSLPIRPAVKSSSETVGVISELLKQENGHNE